MFVLDTDHLSLLQWNVGAEGRLLDQRLSRVPANEIATYYRQLRGTNA